MAGGDGAVWGRGQGTGTGDGAVRMGYTSRNKWEGDGRERRRSVGLERRAGMENIGICRVGVVNLVYA